MEAQEHPYVKIASAVKAVFNPSSIGPSPVQMSEFLRYHLGDDLGYCQGRIFEENGCMYFRFDLPDYGGHMIDIRLVQHARNPDQYIKRELHYWANAIRRYA